MQCAVKFNEDIDFKYDELIRIANSKRVRLVNHLATGNKIFPLEPKTHRV